MQLLHFFKQLLYNWIMTNLLKSKGDKSLTSNICRIKKTKPTYIKMVIISIYVAIKSIKRKSYVEKIVHEHGTITLMKCKYLEIIARSHHGKYRQRRIQNRTKLGWLNWRLLIWQIMGDWYHSLRLVTAKKGIWREDWGERHWKRMLGFQKWNNLNSEDRKIELWGE